MAKKAGAAKAKKSAGTRAKKAVPEVRQKQDERPAEPASEGKVRSFLRLRKKDEKTKAQVSVAKQSTKRSPRTKEGREKPKKQFFHNAAKFFKSVWGELKKVHWPSRRETAVYTMVVLSSVIVVALLLWGADTILSKLLELLLRL